MFYIYFIKYEYHLQVYLGYFLLFYFVILYSSISTCCIFYKINPYNKGSVLTNISYQFVLKSLMIHIDSVKIASVKGIMNKR